MVVMAANSMNVLNATELYTYIWLTWQNFVTYILLQLLKISITKTQKLV